MSRRRNNLTNELRRRIARAKQQERRDQEPPAPAPAPQPQTTSGAPHAASSGFTGKLYSRLQEVFHSHDPEELIEPWDENLLDQFDCHTREFRFEPDANIRQFDYAIEGVHKSGLIWGKCRFGLRSYHVYINASRYDGEMGCNCAESRGQGPCPHTYGFLDYVTDRLQSPGSRFYQSIISGEFDPFPPDPSLFQFDQQAEVKWMLDKYLPISLPEPSEVSLALPEPQETQVDRVAWDFQIKNQRLMFDARLQSPKKRGTGWTKGRRIGLEALCQHREAMSETDLGVERLIHTYRDYRSTLVAHIDPLEAASVLVGAENVLVNSQPAEVDSFELKLRFEQDDQHCSIRIAEIDQSRVPLCVSEQHCVAIDTESGRLYYCPLDTQRADVIRKIQNVPRFPVAYRQQVLERARQLQQYFPIELPDDDATERRTDAPSPVLMLRTRRDGALDFGWRVRDAGGQLQMPGKGGLTREVEHENERYTLVRSPAAERQAIHGAQRSLHLSFHCMFDELHGTLHDFERGLELIERLQDLEEQIEVLWDEKSETPLRVLGSVSPSNVSVGITRKRDWFQLEGSCQLNDDTIDLSEMLTSLQGQGADSIRGDFVRLGDKGWAKISAALRKRFEKLRDSVNQERGKLKFDATSAPAIRDLMEGQIELNGTRAWQDCLKRLEKAEKLEPVVPDELQAELRDYQTEGYRWLRRLAEWGVGGILADDMGLGKTLQTLAVLLDRAQSGPALVIAPTSVGFNWIREAERFTPGLEAHLYRETDRQEFLQQIGPGSLVVCSYGLALRDQEQLSRVEWSTLVLDEAQAIKNSRSKTSAAIAKLSADWKLALTGTPVENHLGELWSLFHVISPGVLGGWEQFRRRFAAPIERDGDDQRRLALRDRLQPFVLRRTKEAVLTDLPALSEMNLYVELSPAERKQYDQVRLSAVGELDDIGNLPDTQDQRFRILALLTRLRQLACSPKLVHQDWKERSAKLQQLCETLTELKEEGHRTLVFSQFVQHLGLIREMLDEEGISYEYLDGATSATARRERVDRFQNGDASVFLISLKAGGTGLNLTAADYVIHMDPWWNPAVEDQATDRAHRIGQDKAVMVYRMVAQGTIEEEILKLHEGKRDLVAGVMEGTQAAGKLSTDDLMELLRGTQTVGT